MLGSSQLDHKGAQTRTCWRSPQPTVCSALRIDPWMSMYVLAAVIVVHLSMVPSKSLSIIQQLKLLYHLSLDLNPLLSEMGFAVVVGAQGDHIRESVFPIIG